MAESEGVRNFHLNSDVDSSKFAQHHTIGTKYGQAAPGEQFASLRTSHEALDEQVNRIGYSKTWLMTAVASTAHNGFTVSGGGWTNIVGSHSNNNDDDLGIHYNGLGIFECVIPKGTFKVDFGRNWDAHATGRRILFFYINESAPGTGNAYRRYTDRPGGAHSFLQQRNATMYLVDGDQIKFAFYQDSGATLGATATEGPRYAGASWSHFLEFTRMG